MTNADTPPPTERDHGPESTEPLSVADVSRLCEDVATNVSRVIVGHDDEIEHVITALLARGHVLLEDVPGVGKTMLARSIATSIDCTFSRIQFTPDLLPTDVTGVNVFNQKRREFEFQPGPIFGNVVLADEINRAPPKTQAALLEAMEETQVTVDGESRSLPTPFTVIATQNAVEPNRTYDLPFAEID
ncbi:MAG: AAA family ATPase, partial [Halorubrum sp.]|uniref:AAA family ATPase n=1 Tax=Halorubrum sp. TaxID=1879286 RepID=UPI0039708DD9